jgi:hypothetical protein
VLVTFLFSGVSLVKKKTSLQWVRRSTVFMFFLFTRNEKRGLFWVWGSFFSFGSKKEKGSNQKINLV